DRMLDMGFIHDIKKVLAIVPAQKQSLLFSATFSDEIKALADKLLNKPALIEVARRNQTADTIAQKVHPVGREMKKDLLAHLIKSNDWEQVLVFTRMKSGANKLVEFLEKQGISAMAIHGNKSQGARTKALAEFKTGDLTVLVATDIAARGIDIDMLPHVVNYELPNVPEDYVHRIGRTGRAGAQGEAISLVCPDENGFLRDIERLIKREIPKEIIEGFAPPVGEKAEPIVLGRMVIGEGAGRGGFRNSGSGGRGGGGGGGHAGRGRNDGRSAPSRSGGGGNHSGSPARSGSGGSSQTPRAPTRDGNVPQGTRAAAPAARPAGPRREGGALFTPRSTGPKR
ncbi:MAG: helicase-related protein, partial [Burkholderiales bacterium]